MRDTFGRGITSTLLTRYCNTLSDCVDREVPLVNWRRYFRLLADMLKFGELV